MAGGRPKGSKTKLSLKPWTDALRVAVSGDDMVDGKRVKRLRRLAEACVSSGIAGDMAAVREIGERLDGKVPQALQGDPDAPLQVQIINTFKTKI